MDSFYRFVDNRGCLGSLVYYLGVPWLLLVWVLQGRPVEPIDPSYYVTCVNYMHNHVGMRKNVCA